MEPEKLHKLIGAMLITVLTQGLPERIRHLGTLCDHVHYFITSEKVERDRAPIMAIRQKLIDAYLHFLSGNIERDKLDQAKAGELRDNFIRHGIVLDRSWGTPGAAYNAQVVKELEGVRAAKTHYLRAVDHYSKYLSGNPGGLTGATIEVQAAIQILMTICYDNDLVELSEGEWRKIAAQRPAPVRPASLPEPARPR